MSIMVLQHRTTTIAPVPPDTLLEPGAILVFGADGEATLDDLSALIKQWRSNPWCAVALLAPEVARRAILRPLLPEGMRVEAIGEAGDVAAVIRAGVAAAMPSDVECTMYLANRLGVAAASAIAKGVDPNFAGTGARRELARRGLPAPGYWRSLLGTVAFLGTALANQYSQAIAADIAGVSIKTLSRRCAHLFGQPWRVLVGLGVWEAMLEVGLRHGSLVDARESPRLPVALGKLNHE